jgi:hypothetical protein
MRRTSRVVYPMDRGRVTLRVIPEMFRSVLFDGDDRWDLPIRDRESHPCAFTPLRDRQPRTTLPARPAKKRRPPVRAEGERHTPTVNISPKHAVVSHSADRLAKAIVLATNSPGDPRTLTAWGQQVGVSRGALRVWCEAAGVSGRSSLDFLRVLRAVVLSRNQTWDLLSLLDVVDQRSLLKLLDRGGVRELCREKPPTVDEFMLRQHFLDNQDVLQAVTRRLNAGRR